MSNLTPPANTSSPPQQPIIGNVKKNSTSQCISPADKMEPTRQSAGASTPKAGALPPPFLSQSPKNGAFNLNEEDIAIRIMMRQAEDDPYWVIENIGESGIENQEKLAEIAWKCLEKVSWLIARNFNDFNIKEENVRIDIAWALLKEEPSELAKNFNKFDIKSESVRIDIAWALLKKEPSELAKNFNKFDIKNESVRIDIAWAILKETPRGLAQNFNQFDIQNEAVRIDIARALLKQEPSELAKNFNQFGIKNEAVQRDIALNLVKEAPRKLAQNFNQFDIQNEAVRIEIAQALLKQEPSELAKNFNQFGIKNEAVRIEIARALLKQASSELAQNFNQFDIKNESVRIEIAQALLKEAPRELAQNFNQFDIQNEAVRIEIAQALLKEDSWMLAEFFEEFDIKDPAACREIVLEFTKKDPEWVVYAFKNKDFNIKEEAIRIEIARECLKEASEYVSENFTKFNIKDEASRRDIARECAKVNPWIVLRYIANFNLSDTNVFREIVERCLQENKFLCIQLSNHSELLLLRRELYRRGLVESEKPVATESENLLLDRVWFYLKNMNKHKSGRLPKAEWVNFAAALLQLRDPTMARNILDLIKENSGDEKIAHCYKEIASLRLQQKIDWEVLLRWSLAALAAQGVSVQELIKALNGQLFRQFKDKLKARRLLDVLLKIGENTELNKEDKQWVIEQLKGIDEVKKIRMLLFFEAEKHLKKGDVSLENRLDKAIRENIGEDIDVSAFIADIERTFGKSRNPEAIWQFFVSMKQTGEPETMAAFRDYCSSVADGSFLQQRCDTKRSKHLQELIAIKSDSLEIWKKPVDPIDIFAAKAWLKTKIVDDQHLGHFASAELIGFLGGSASSAPALAWQPGQAHAFTQTCRELTNATQRQQYIDLLNALQQQLIAADFTGKFLNDIKGQLQLITQKGGLRGIDTDDPYHLLLCGTEVEGSCQRVDGEPRHNKGLLGYLLHGQTRLLAVVDAQERIVTRSLLRLLIGKDKNGKPYPVLFLEYTYGKLAYQPTLQALAQKKAAAMGLPLAQLDDFTKAHDKTPPPLESLGGPAPYEYCDASDGACKNGKFTIEHAVWLDTATSAEG